MSNSASYTEGDPEVAKAAFPIVEQIRDEMGNTWSQDDLLLEKFFPESTSDSRCQKALKGLHNAKKHVMRWKGIPSSPKTLSKLYTSLTNLMNNILFYYRISRDERLFLNTHGHSRAKVAGTMNVAPGIFLAGIGPEFASTWAELPRASFSSGISAFEVSLDSDDLTEARDRLAVHMHRIFQNQFNRRFAYGLLITQHMFTVYMFDHSGAVASKPCNYHAHPAQFCAVISGLASRRDRIGFDYSMYSRESRAIIRTLEPTRDDSVVETEYVVERPLFQFPCLVGRGTICWLASRSDKSGSVFVVKDAWIAPSELAGRESEASLLRHAQSQGVISGVAQIHHFEEVRRSADTLDLDTVLRNRRVEGNSPEDRAVERIHTRIVMTTYGKTLDEFSTKLELLLAFHDAVLAHRRLHDVAGILHRDISVRNILINPEGVEGNRGVLIDFDHAIRVDDTSPYSTRKKIGTWRYMSRNVLNGRGPHTYLDDLESFYYVLCWILVAYEEPGIGKAETPTLIAVWDLPGASDFKMGLLTEDFEQPVAPWFGNSLRRLIIRLHQFFQCRYSLVDKPVSSLDHAKDYDEFLSHIRQGIADLEEEPRPAGPESPLPSHKLSNPSSAGIPGARKRKRELDEVAPGDASPPAVQKQGKRPRRTKAAYGNPTN